MSMILSRPCPCRILQKRSTDFRQDVSVIISREQDIRQIRWKIAGGCAYRDPEKIRQLLQAIWEGSPSQFLSLEDPRLIAV